MKRLLLAGLLVGCGGPVVMATDLPIVSENEPNNRAETANYIDVPATIVGTLEAGDRDCFRTALSVAVVDGALTMTREGNATCVEGVGDYRLAVSK